MTHTDDAAYSDQVLFLIGSCSVYARNKQPITDTAGSPVEIRHQSLDRGKDSWHCS